MNADDSCRCCGAGIEYEFAVPSWRAPGWPTFRYGECGQCHSLTLLDGVDPGSFYRNDFAHRPRPPVRPSVTRRTVASVAEALVMPCRRGAIWPGRALRRPEWLTWFAGSGLTRGSAVLDVGAGSGALLGELHRWGFRNVSGCDPYLEADVSVAPGVVVQAVALAEVQRGDFGAIIFHQSLEHADDPLTMLQIARTMLSRDGARVVVALPMAQGPVWHEYRDNWVALDAPVHRFIPTLEGLQKLAARAGFDVGRICPGSTPYHLIGSEMVAKRADPTSDARSMLSEAQLASMRRRAHRLRRPGQSPQASAVLVPRGP